MRKFELLKELPWFVVGELVQRDNSGKWYLNDGITRIADDYERLFERMINFLGGDKVVSSFILELPQERESELVEMDLRDFDTEDRKFKEIEKAYNSLITYLKTKDI